MSQPSADHEAVRLDLALASAAHDLTSVVAVLWTWLEANLRDLNSLSLKGPAIALRAAREPLKQMSNEVLDWVKEDRLTNAALLLARIHEGLKSGGAAPLFDVREGVDGREVLVVWQVPALAMAMANSTPAPPQVNEHPALASFAPRLSVRPVEVDGIRLVFQDLPGAGWRATDQQLAAALGQRALEIHLDTLGDRGLLEPEISEGDEPRCSKVWFEDVPGSEIESEAIAAVEEAVNKASQLTETDRASVLLLPELVASPATLAALKAALLQKGREGGIAPVLTIVGLRNVAVPADADELERSQAMGGGELARGVNEAVILDQSGGELWRHRKMTSAAADIGSGVVAVEDIRAGRTLTVVPSSIGALAVVICLDAFAESTSSRMFACPASVLLVPSLSPNVLRHRGALQLVAQRIWGAAFVCNRAIARSSGGVSSWNDDRRRSFWAVQRSELQVPDALEAGEHPSFVYRMALEQEERDFPDDSRVTQVWWHHGQPSRR